MVIYPGDNIYVYKLIAFREIRLSAARCARIYEITPDAPREYQRMLLQEALCCTIRLSRPIFVQDRQ